MDEIRRSDVRVEMKGLVERAAQWGSRSSDTGACEIRHWCGEFPHLPAGFFAPPPSPFRPDSRRTLHDGLLLQCYDVQVTVGMAYKVVS